MKPLNFWRKSLSARLIWSAAVWLFIGFLAGAFLLSRTFSSSVADNFDTTLQVDLDGLIAAAEPDDQGGIYLQDRFVSRRFSRVYSGLYWQIDTSDGKPSQISRSLFDHTLTLKTLSDTGGIHWGYTSGPDSQHLRVIARRITFPATEEHGKQTFHILVAGDLSHVERQVRDFNHTLFRAFALLWLALLIAIFVQVHIGLAPLRKVIKSLNRIRRGEAQRLEGTFPTEIAPLAEELNSLIAHSAEVVGRARTHVGNLAHFFKTPLSVLASAAEANPGPLSETVQKQVTVMRRQVDYYLTRARAAGSVSILGNRTPVTPVVESLARALEQIHRAKNLDIAVEGPETIAFRGERQDLEEMAGNLMDNACKWARTEVQISVRENPDASFTISVCDDGRGLAPEDRTEVLGRGKRLDESVPGSGLGLSIVVDIAKLYGGSLELDESPAHGLAARLTLPRIS